jgi:AmiR/NasT family two-component response regulator
VVGTLNLFISEPRPLSPADISAGQALAHAATIAILQDDAARGARTTVAQFRHALNTRVTIEQAKGVLSEREGITSDEAFTRLRATARKHRLKLSALATSVVERSVPQGVLTDLEAGARGVGPYRPGLG